MRDIARKASYIAKMLPEAIQSLGGSAFTEEGKLQGNHSHREHYVEMVPEGLVPNLHRPDSLHDSYTVPEH